MLERCSLCGGRIRDGRCQECGMPLQKTTARLAAGYDDEPAEKKRGAFGRDAKKRSGSGDAAWGKPGGGSGDAAWKKTGDAFGKAAQRKAHGASGKKKNKKKRGRSCFSTILALLPVILAAGYALMALVVPFFSEDEEWNSVSEYVGEDLPEGDESFSEVLSPGFYEVGVQIPVGEYTAYYQSGTGDIVLSSSEYDLEVRESMGASDDADSTELSCYEGFILYLDGDLTVTLDTDSAVSLPDDAAQQTGGFAATFSGGGDDTPAAVAGEDFPAGFYDLTTDAAGSEIYYDATDAGGEIYYDTYTFSLDDEESKVKNVLLTDGTELYSSGTVTLTSPEDGIGADWDEEFYGRLSVEE